MGANSNGTPTSLGIPTLSPGQDTAGPLGVNEIVQVIDSKIAGRLIAPTALDKQVIKWSQSSGTYIASYVEPGEIGQEGASNGQALLWSSANNKWQPGSAGSLQTIFDVVVGRGQSGDPAAPAANIDSNTILGGVLPTTYKHLRLCLSGATSAAVTSAFANVQFNGDTTAAYGDDFVGGTTAVGGSEDNSATFGMVAKIAGASATSGATGVNIIDILDYQGTTFWKVWTGTIGIGLDITTGNRVADLVTGLWKNKSAITRVNILPGSGSFVAGTRATLYGVS